MSPTRTGAARWFALWCAVCVACNDDLSNVRTGVDPDGVLTPDPSGSPVSSGGAMEPADSGAAQDPDSGFPEDDADAGLPTEPAREVDRSVTTTTPKAKFKYVGSGDPPLSVVASNLALTNFPNDVSAQWFLRIRNERLLETLCAFALTFTFKDSLGRELFTLEPTFDMPPFASSISSARVRDCIGPGAEVNGQTIYFGEDEAPIELDQIATVEWKFVLAGYFDSSNEVFDVTISDLSKGSAAYGPSLLGHVSNDSPHTLQVFSVHAWVMNAGGMPLDYFIASYEGDLPAFGQWDFETTGSAVDFDLDDLEVLPSYVR